MDAFLAMFLALLKYNLTLTLGAIAIALPVSCFCAVARLSSIKLISYPMRVYVNVLRSLPLVLVMFWIYMVLPIVGGMSVSAFWAALVALALFEIAYFTEIVRAGIQSVSINQWSAGLASGLSRYQGLRHIIIPQALRRMTPALLMQSLIAFQDSTISSIIGVPEILQVTTIINAREQDPVTLYILLAVTFFVLCFLASTLVNRLEIHYRTRLGY
ncbi:amino acid ABC transporter permease [Leptospira interrogans]